MGSGGTLKEGFLFIPDGSPRPVSGERTGWFVHPEMLGISLNVAIWLVIGYFIVSAWSWLKGCDKVKGSSHADRSAR